MASAILWLRTAPSPSSLIRFRCSQQRSELEHHSIERDGAALRWARLFHLIGEKSVSKTSTGQHASTADFHSLDVEMNMMG